MAETYLDNVDAAPALSDDAAVISSLPVEGITTDQLHIRMHVEAMLHEITGIHRTPSEAGALLDALRWQGVRRH
jgi:hypothetical protein